MSMIESIVNTGLSLNNTYTQGKALIFSGEEVNKDAAKAYLLKTLEEYFAGRIDGSQAAGNVINALTDYKVTTYLEEKGVPAVLAKSIGLIASSIAGSIAKGLADKLFAPKDTVATAESVLTANGRMPQVDASMLDKLKSLLSGDAGSVLKPLLSGLGRSTQSAAGV